MSEFEAEHGKSTEPEHLPQRDAGAAAASVGEIEAQGEAHDGGGAEKRNRQAAGDVSKEASTASVETGGQEEEHTTCLAESHGSCSAAGMEEGGEAAHDHNSHGCSHEGHDHNHEVYACSCRSYEGGSMKVIEKLCLHPQVLALSRMPSPRRYRMLFASLLLKFRRTRCSHGVHHTRAAAL